MIIILICSFKTQSTFVMLVYHCHYLACYCYFGFPLFSVVGDHFERFYYRKWWYVLSKFVQQSKVGAAKFDSILIEFKNAKWPFLWILTKGNWNRWIASHICITSTLVAVADLLCAHIILFFFFRFHAHCYFNQII